MKTLTINWISWIKAYFMAANPGTNSQPAMYHRATTLNNKKELKPEDKKPGKIETKPCIGDLMRTAHRGNFSAGPTFLFHPGWFK